MRRRRGRAQVVSLAGLVSPNSAGWSLARRARLLCLGALTVAGLSGLAGAATASVGVPLTGRRTGPLALEVFLSPQPARVGRVDLAVLLPGDLAGTAGAPRVRVAVRAVAAGRRVEVFMTPAAAAGSTLQVAHLPLTVAGRWRIEIEARGPAGVSGRFVADVDIGPAGPPILVWVLGALAVVVAAFAWRRGLAARPPGAVPAHSADPGRGRIFEA